MKTEKNRLFVIERDVGGNGFDGPRRSQTRHCYLPPETVIGTRLATGPGKGYFVIRRAGWKS